MRHEAERPADEDEQAVLEADQVAEVDERARSAQARKPLEPDALRSATARGAADRRQVALVAVAERRRRAALEAVADDAAA